jgi:hypothetical protein
MTTCDFCEEKFSKANSLSHDCRIYLKTENAKLLKAIEDKNSVIFSLAN